MTLDDLNQLSDREFINALGSIYEHSPWVAKGVLSQRPFQDHEALILEMASYVDAKNDDEKLTLLRAHPELAGKAAIDGNLTDASVEEQASAGLDRMSPDEFARFADLNSAYQKAFEFPFIICVKENTKSSILDAMDRRSKNTVGDEFTTAINEVHKIARLRLEALFDDD